MRLAVILSLGTSAVLGTGALLAARALIPSTPAASASGASANGQTVPVVLAKAPFVYGDALTADKLVVERMPASLVPEGAFTTINQVIGAQGTPPVALAAMSAHEPVLPGKISGPGARKSVAVEVAPGMRAYTVRVTDATAVGGHALPGDRVDVVLMRTVANAQVFGKEPQITSSVVVQNVRLLGVNLNADPASKADAAAADPRTATLEVSLTDAEKLAVAGSAGSLSLALRRSGAVDVEAARTIQVSDVVSGQSAPAPAPAARRRTIPVRHQPTAARPSSLQIVQGGKSEDVAAPSEKHGGV